jgi:DNA (cytosine-5)-methyltransferase 1
MEQITLGSLFDGIGAFPYAAALFGVKTLWASEILPTAISVTKRHFPDMIHVGDITKLSGELLPPVDIIAFGSPCQDLSQAAGGNRKGLDGERSGLFMEAIRIIKEMRKSTNGQYPKYAIWENVVGCFSSNARSDYRAVLSAFTDTEIPMPKSGRWANAGMVRSGKVNLAWCVYDAQHFGLAQRRKRVFLIADFAKGNPEKILLVPKSLSRHFTQSEAEGQGVTAIAESGTYGTGAIAFHGGASPQAGSIAYSDKVSPTLKSASSGLRTPCVCEPKIAILNDQGGYSLNVEKDGRSPTLRCNTHGNLPVICVASTQSDACISNKLCPTITAAAGNSGNNKPYIVHPKIAGTLCASAAGLSRPGGMGSETDLCVAVDCRNFKEVGGLSGTLQAKGKGGYSLNYQNPIRDGYIVRRLTPTECELLMGFPIGWTEKGANDEEISDSKRYSMLGNSIATSCAAYIIDGIIGQYKGGLSNWK